MGNKNVVLKVFKILTVVLYVIAVAVAAIIMVDTITNPSGLGTAIGILVWMIIGAIALAIPLVSAIIGLIISIIKKVKEQCNSGSVIFFIIFTALPIATYFLGILVFTLVL